MIKSFRHKGLEDFFLTGSKKGIVASHSQRLAVRLLLLDRIHGPDEIFLCSAWRPHKVAGKNPKGQDVEGFWAIAVTGSWRLVFTFDEAGDVVLLDYMDYH